MRGAPLMRDARDLLRSLLTETSSGEPWHGASVMATLAGLTPAQALAHPIAGAHSIAETVRHMAAWNRIVAARLSGRDPEVTSRMDWPRVDARDPEAWTAARSDFEASVSELERALQQSDAAWYRAGESGFVLRRSRNALGSLTHLTWHAGQISMLRRAQGLPPHEE